ARAKNLQLYVTSAHIFPRSLSPSDFEPQVSLKSWRKSARHVPGPNQLKSPLQLQLNILFFDLS
ncbi:unnamed protein product, partial [Allacma fusca]